MTIADFSEVSGPCGKTYSEVPEDTLANPGSSPYFTVDLLDAQLLCTPVSNYLIGLTKMLLSSGE